jgi:hypothetical protein
VLGPCAPPLALEPAAQEGVPGRLVTLAATGGTGRYRFELVNAPSGGAINARTGAYRAGATSGVTDRVQLRDDGCLGSAEAEIAVRPPFGVDPAEIELRPGESFRFRAHGGSGEARFRWVRGDAGGQITPDGQYTAGAAPGRDIVEAEDTRIGVAEEAVVVVTEAPRFEVEPGWIGLAVGATFRLEATGGSGALTVQGDGPYTFADGVLQATDAGDFELTVRDAFLEREARVRVQARLPLGYEAPRWGVDEREARLLGAYDLDGDGRRDLVLGHPSADADAFDGGAVFVYRGGFEAEAGPPRWQVRGARRGDRLGSAVAVGDVDGDGRLDLLVGAPGEDRNGRGNAGVARLFLGTDEGFGEAVWEVSGRESEELGASLAACDFNGDGRLDVAVGRPRATDRRRADPRFAQGAVSLYLGRADGLPGEPDQELFGDVPDGAGGWVGQTAMELGAALAAGDVDGDGLCDLAAAAPNWDREGSFDDGLVALFAGRARAGNDLGGVAARPARLWAELDPEDRGSRFGFDVVLEDLSGDGRPDLVVGQPGRDGGPADRYGAVRVFARLDNLTPDPTVQPASDADATRTFDRGFSDFGTRVAVARVDGDARPDLIVGVPQGEADGVPGNAGGVLVFAGSPQGVVDAEPTWSFWGDSANARVGAAVAAVDDLDEDGLLDVIALASTGGSAGVEVGALVSFSSASGEALHTWTWPGVAAGVDFGAGAAIVGDVDGDGADDVVVGAPRLAEAVQGRDAGRFWLYGGAGGPLATEPLAPYWGFDLHSSFDRLGESVASGDFDGDDRADAFVAARFEDQPDPSSFDDGYVVEDTCTESRNNTGAVFVFRGRGGGLQPRNTPDFILFGEQANAGITALAGEVDVNGDGRTELVAASTTRSDPQGARTGGIGLHWGRDRGVGQTVVACGPGLGAYGAGSDDDFGIAAAGLGDLDGDGCEELGVGAARADAGLRDVGTLNVLWGFGGAGCPGEPAWSVIAGGTDFGNFGTAVAGGRDLDGDGTPDVIVGAPRAENPERVGSVVAISGAALTRVPRAPSPAEAEVVSVDALPGTARAFSDAVEGRFGQAVAVGGDAESAWIAVGVPRGDVGGRVLHGGVEIWAWRSGGLARVGAIAGGARPEAQFGEILSARGSGLLAGSRFDSAVLVDGGAIYRFQIEDLTGR